jgi:hypothetical protein
VLLGIAFNGGGLVFFLHGIGRFGGCGKTWKYSAEQDGRLAPKR